MFSDWNVRTGLKSCREVRGLTQAELANKCGLQPSAIGHFEQGGRVPTIGNVVKLADALNVTVDVLIDRKTR